MSQPNSLDLESRGDMLEGTARVVAVTGGTVWLEAESQSSCGSCSTKKGCGVSVLSGVMGNKAVRFRMPNDFNGRIGDRVVIGIPEGAVVRASMLAYLLPVVAMIAGALIATGLGGGDAGAAIGAVIGLALGFGGMRLVSARTEIQPVFLRRTGGMFDLASCGTNHQF